MKPQAHRSLLFTILPVIVFVSNFSALADKLYIYYPTPIRPQIIQNKLTEACPGVSITVFGRYRDFRAKMEMDDPPVAILGKSELIKQYPEYRIVLFGVRKNSTIDTCLLLSIDGKVDLSNIGDFTIGSIDYFGRKSTEDFIREILNGTPKVKRVTKVEDLIPLLTFKMVDAILVENRIVNYFRKTSNLNFIETKIPKGTCGILTVAVRKDDDNTVLIEDLKKLSKDILQILTIEEWK